MDYNLRREEIFRLRNEEKKKLQQIAEVFGITRERVRQILLPQKFCQVHGRSYTTQACRGCKKEERKKAILEMFPNVKPISLETFVEDELLEKIAYVRTYDRRQQVVQRRDEVIIYLREVKKLSFPAIGELLHRDHTTIMSNYYKLRPRQEVADVNK